MPGMNSDLGNGSFWVEIRNTKLVDRFSWRSTRIQARSQGGFGGSGRTPLFRTKKKKIDGVPDPEFGSCVFRCDRASTTVGLRTYTARPRTESWKCCSVDQRQTIGIPSNVHYLCILVVFCVDWKGLRLRFTMNHLFCSWGFGWVDKAQCSDRLARCRWFEPGLQVPGFSRHLASRHLSRNTLFICLKQSSKLFQIIQHYCSTTPPHVVPMYFKSSVHWRPSLGMPACRKSGTSVMSRRYLDIQNFFGNWRKSLNFGVFTTLNLKCSGELPQTPAKCNPPFQYPGYVPGIPWYTGVWSHRTDLWPQVMFTFSKCLQWSCLKAVSVPTFVI